jgi:pimeloyl-ACP methyl ester carboxylesterase
MDLPILYSKIEGSGTPILILHGFLGMSDNWKSVALTLGQKGFEVHALDLRNHGRSFHHNTFTYEAMSDDIKRYCNANKLSEIHVLGHSMGGKTAMLFACKYPELVKSLTVADIGTKYYPPHHQDILNGLVAVDFSHKPDRAAVDSVLKQFIKIASVRQFLTRSLYWKSQEQLDFRFNVPVFMESYDEIGKALPESLSFSKEVLFIRGGVSNYILDDDWTAIQQQFPRAVLETIPEVGHWLHAENPTMFIEILLNFYDKNQF